MIILARQAEHYAGYGKVWRWGPAAGRLAGAAALALAVATIWLPWLAPGLHAAPQMMMN